MPVYEYECEKCGRTEEIIQNFSDAPLKKCSICSGKLRKLMSSNAFHLKGSGWYVTDYNRTKKADSSKKESTKNKVSKDNKNSTEINS